MRIGWMTVALVALNRTAAAADVTAFIAVDSAASTYAAKQIASSVLRQAGVTIDWRAPKPPLTGAPRPWLRIELTERTPEERLPGALAVSYPYDGCAKGITVFYDRVRHLARGADRESALLAYVLVHEIAHILQGVDRHSDTGVMKRRWSAEDRVAIFERRLAFEEEDLFLMRTGLAIGWCRRPGTLTDRSESGIAPRPE